MSKNIITVTDLSKAFRFRIREPGLMAAARSIVSPRYKAIQAVNNISFSVKPGEILAFIGPNGAGKSSTIKMLTGIMYPSSGKVEVAGLNPATDRQTLSYKISTVFGQRSQLSFHLPAIESLDLLARIYELDRAEYKLRLKTLIETFELEELLTQPVRKLSLGQRMRFEIAAALVHRPTILFLDEPTIGLDVVAKNKIRELIRKLNKEDGITVFLTSHDAGDIEALAERTIVINHGQVVFDDKTTVFKERYIKNKLVELVVANGAEDFKFSAAQIVERDEFSLKAKIPNSVQAIEAILKYALENFEVQDINISDPALEEIIAIIYQEKVGEARA